MSGIRPFRGSVVRQVVAHDVVSPAYDALTVQQRRAFRTDHPNSYLHVTRSAQDESDADTVDNATLVARGRAALEKLLEQNLFDDHGGPAFYIYRLRLAGHQQTGLVCEIPGDYYSAVSLAHEATRSERAALLAEHFTTVRAASSPVACAVRDADGTLESELKAASQSEPLLVVTTEDGLQQAVWRIDDVDLESRLIDTLQHQPLFIIDGHHRSAAIEHLHQQGETLPVLTAIFPEQSLSLVGFHRLLKLGSEIDSKEVLRRISRRFRVELTSDVTTVAAGSVALFLDETWYIVHFDEPPVGGSAQIRLGALDPVVLEREILRTIVGSMGTYDVSYMPDTEPFSVIVATAKSQGRIPLFVPPVAIDDMMAVAAGGEVMPPKSTYFMPKVRSGVFLRLLD